MPRQGSFHLLVNKGYGTVRVAKYLNDKGIKTKRDKGPWRGTAIRALIDNPIYIGHMHMGEALSPKFENLQIIDDDLFARCQEVVKGRATILKKDMSIPERTDTGSMLSGIGDLVSWADAFDEADPETRKMIIARLVERIDIGADYLRRFSCSPVHFR